MWKIKVMHLYFSQTFLLSRYGKQKFLQVSVTEVTSQAQDFEKVASSTNRKAAEIDLELQSNNFFHKEDDNDSKKYIYR